jgi:transcriptional regulator with XRE-family HTH domain
VRICTLPISPTESAPASHAVRMGTIKPTIRLRRLGLELRQHREAAGLNLEEAAVLLKRSASSISRIEKALHHAPVRDVEYFLGKYGVTDQSVYQRLYDLSRNGRKKGWWQKHADDLVPEMMEVISLEADAISIEFFEVILIPGLLQTEEYARALIGNGLFARDPERVDRLVDVRMRRQQILRRPDPPRFWAIVDEAALRREVGGPEVMCAQLRRLLEVSRLGQVTLQVLPFTAGSYRGMTGAFKIMEVGERGDLRVVALDSLVEVSFREEEDEVRAYADTFDILRAAALSETDSRALIESLLSEHDRTGPGPRHLA